MNYPFRARIVILMCALLVACGQTSQVGPTSTPLPTNTAIPSLTATPQLEATPTVDINAPPTFSFFTPNSNVPSPTPNPKIPTLIPTIDPSLVADLLRKSISIQTIAGVNEHNLQRITGWDYGFSCTGYQWLDSKHLLLYPRTGQAIKSFMGGSRQEGLSSEPIIVNISNGTFWLLPQSNMTSSESACNSVFWSPTLGIIIYQENNENTSESMVDNLFTYAFDAQKITQYNGKISGVSPSGEKILVDDNAIIDLRNNKITSLNWHVNEDPAISSKLYWSSDETQVYRCCFYYANLNTGESYEFEWGDLRGPDGKPLPLPMNPYHTGGQWVRNDTYFFPTWDYMSYAGDPIGILSPTTKNYYFIELSSTPPIDTETLTYTFSPDGMYVWMRGINSGYGTAYGFLSNLTTLETTSYNIDTSEFEWSPDGKFACLRSSPSNSSFPLQTNLLSISSKKLEPLDLNSCPSWRQNDHLFAYLAKEYLVLAILNPKDMSVKGWKLPSAFRGLIWSPDGSQFLLIAKDGSFWHVDYPKMDNFEQLTQPMSMEGIRDITWSPDNKSIAYIKDADLYVVEVTK